LISLDERLMRKDTFETDLEILCLKASVKQFWRRDKTKTYIAYETSDLMALMRIGHISSSQMKYVIAGIQNPTRPSHANGPVLKNMMNPPAT